ncbi:MAG: Cna B-type domain-containing protein [Clostridia bacterium]|nr:Cna B-type domain-containing protein [Clostridia bacterium]
MPTHDINGRKVWIDENNIHLTRPESITVTLYADGQALDNRPIWTSTEGNTWSYTFANLPTVRENGATINYTVKETPVENYETTVNGFTITNRLIEKPAEKHVMLEGAKTWDDHENAKGKRPNVITVRLFRDGVEIDSRDVTAATGWTYSFGKLPADDGYGNIYIYELREDAVPGYFQRVDGMNVINKLLDYDTPETPEGGTSDDDSVYQAKKARLEVLTRKTGSSRPRYEDYTEEELEELFDLFGYGTPLFGMLGTGDETPAYPFVFAGIGVIALAVALFIRRKRRYE